RAAEADHRRLASGKDLNDAQKKSRAGSPASNKTTKGGGEHPQMLHCIIWIIRRIVNGFDKQNLLPSSEHKVMRAGVAQPSTVRTARRYPGCGRPRGRDGAPRAFVRQLTE
ncbi:MAG TPA: hypothetical protein PKH44_04855, partial [Plasticicumulans sp.]|nr:hypothetical protein [Plasticicumulans sp.]